MKRNNDKLVITKRDIKILLKIARTEYKRLEASDNQDQWDNMNWWAGAVGAYEIVLETEREERKKKKEEK